MVKLIQIKRLGPRIEGMLYKRKFDEQWLLLDDASILRLPASFLTIDYRVHGRLQKLVMHYCVLSISRKF